MYDLHSHILPGVDDGPDDWDMAVRMLKAAVKDGIKGIVATPHVAPGLFDTPRERVLGLVAELRLKAGGLPIDVYPGSELAVSVEALSGISDGRHCTINSGMYALVEFPGSFRAQTAYDFIFRMTKDGFVPVLAHPERNPAILSNIDILYEMVRMGALGQVTAGSLTGRFGNEIRRTAKDMVKRRLVHVIASDAHSDVQRPPELSAAVNEVSRIAGRRPAEAMVHDLPLMILQNERFNVAEPEHHRSWLGIF